MAIYMISQGHRQHLEEFEFQQYVPTQILAAFHNSANIWVFLLETTRYSHISTYMFCFSLVGTNQGLEFAEHVICPWVRSPAADFFFRHIFHFFNLKERFLLSISNFHARDVCGGMDL